MPNPNEGGSPGAGGNPGEQLSPASTAPQKEQRLELVKGGKPDAISDLGKLPATGAYLNRIGAEVVHFRLATIKVIEQGYPKTVGRVTFDPSGSVTTFGKAEQPTAAEQEAIKAEFATAKFPKIMPLTAIGDLPPGVSKLSDPGIFVCHDFDGNVVMVHQRYENRDGTKGFLPWTYWSDGQWRRMEPDDLPFFGLPGWSEHSTLFIHEGAKAAAQVKRILANEEQADFPWREDMRWGHHIGWIGGVHALDRSDWDTLASKPWSRVIIVADNDQGGLDAARQIAEHFTCDVFTVSFDQRFKDGFDCGDPWPDDLFDEDRRYIGPTMDDCLRPSMKATEVGELDDGERGRPPVFIRRGFAQRVAFTIIPQTFIFRDRPSRTYSADEFNALTAPFSDAPKSTAAKLLSHYPSQHERLQYDCAHKPGTLIAADGRRDWNVFQPTRVRPLAGDPALWLGFLAHLFPDAAERAEVEKWLATLIALPRIRMRYGLLLISTTQGVGKNTLANILVPLLGADNVSFPSEQAVVDSQFNDWLACKRLVFVAEIYSGSSRAAYDKMKSVVTDDICTINEKRVKPYKLANWATVIACSNSLAALHLDKEDRRWFVPTVSDREQPTEWWSQLYRWLRADGAGIIMQWALDFVRDGNHVRTGDRAPGSARKELIVEGSRSEGQSLANALAEHIRDWPEPVIVRVSDVRQWVARKRGFLSHGEPNIGDRRLEKAGTITAAMRAVPGITVWADKMRPKFGVLRDAVVMNFEPEPGGSWANIQDLLKKVEEIEPL